MNAYCVMCRTGSEQKVAREITKEDPSLAAIAPVRILQEKRDGTWRSREKKLLPGYVFIFSVDDFIPVDVLRQVRHLYKILDYGQGLRQLQHADYEYAMWLFRYHGQINSSRILSVGQKVIAIEGPLSDAIGTIVHMDRRKRRAWVEFEFDGHKRTVSLSAEWISAGESAQNQSASG